MPTNPSDLAGPDRSPLDIAERAFRMLACAPSSLAVDGRQVGHGLPSRRMLLIELRDVLIHPSCSNAARDAVWRLLVTRARQNGPQWMVSAVGVAVPALRGISGRICRGYVAGDPEDIDTEVLTAFIEAIRTVNLGTPNVFTRMCAVARRAGERARENAEAGVARRFPLQESAPPAVPWGHPDLVLLDAVAKGVISEVDAELIGMTRLEKRTLADAARQLGLTTEAAKKRRQRCEPILVDAVLSGEVEAATSLTISPAPSRGVKEDVPMISARSRSSDTQPDTTRRKGGRGSLTGSARIPHLPALRKPRRHIVRVLLVVGIAVAIVAVLVAAAVADGGNATATIHAAAPPTRPDQLEKVFTNLRNWIVGLLATLATLMFTIGGLRYLVAGGDPGEVQKAKVAFKAAALGYALAVLAPLFVNVLKHVVGG
ncbi:pilin [Microbispora sp. H10949]|uniref:pilin n=1 Tax=Microbispora sp. H10949 TaxID=2729111 RepID=UPI0016000061|nr:pilin [Microbispora sp. H10949]